MDDEKLVHLQIQSEFGGIDYKKTTKFFMGMTADDKGESTNYNLIVLGHGSDKMVACTLVSMVEQLIDRLNPISRLILAEMLLETLKTATTSLETENFADDDKMKQMIRDLFKRGKG
jgi:precorrin-6B methylase 2